MAASLSPKTERTSVDPSWRVLDDVVEQPGDLGLLVGAGLAQDVGDGLGMGKALAGPNRNAVVGIEKEIDRGAADGTRRGHGYAHSAES